MIGELISEHYRLDALLGQGGMGAVYAATDLRSGARVALKTMLSAEGLFTPGLLVRFEREARAASRLNTPHIARCLDFNADPSRGTPFLALELLSGQDLEQTVEARGPLPWPVALKIVLQAAKGLGAAHDVGIIHRDVKSANLFLHREGDEIVVKLLDFGIAKVLLEDASSAGPAGLTRTGAVLGSPYYMSPEQAQALKTADHRSDVWSLGMVLYEALAGKTAFHEAGSVGQLLLWICTRRPPPLGESAPWVPAEVAALVERCLRQDPETRFASVRAFGARAAELIGTQDLRLRESELRPLSDDERRASPSTPPARTQLLPSVPPRPSEAPLTEALPALTAEPAASRPGAQPRRLGPASFSFFGALGLAAALGAWLTRAPAASPSPELPASAARLALAPASLVAPPLAASTSGPLASAETPRATGPRPPSPVARRASSAAPGLSTAQPPRPQPSAAPEVGALQQLQRSFE